MDFFILVMTGLANGSMYVLMALGLVLIYKAQDMVQFAHGELFTAGAFLGFTAYTHLQMPYVAAFLVAIGGGALIGLIVERTVMRPISEMPHMTLVMVTVGLSFMLKGLVRVPFGKDIYTFPSIFGGGSIQVFGLVVAPQVLVMIVVSVVLTLALFALFRFTIIGKQMRATSQNTMGARLCGVNVGRVYATTWATASAMGAAAGILAAPITLLYPDMGTNILLKGFASAVLGGFGSVPGAIVGGYLVGQIEMMCGAYVATALKEVSSFIVIMFVLILRPQGLFGVKAARRV